MNDDDTFAAKLFSSNFMRQLLFVICILFQFNAYAQVPRPIRGDVGEHYSTTIPEPGKASTVASIYQQNGKYGFVSPAGQKQELIYEKITSNYDGFIVKKDGLFGIADKTGKLIGKIEFESIEKETYRFGNSYIVKKNGNFGSIDQSGKTILAPKYAKVLFSDYRNPLSFVTDKDGQMRMVTNVGEKLYAGQIDFVELYANVAVLKVNGKFGVVKRGQAIVPFVYDSIFRTNVDTYGAYTNKRQIPQKGVVFSSQTFDRLITNLIVKKADKFGLVDTTGKLVYAPEYDQIKTEAHEMLSNQYLIEKDKQVGMYFGGIDKKIPLIYDRIYRDGASLILAGKGKKVSAFNTRGEKLFPEEYESIRYFNSKYYLVSKDGKYGLLDKAGKLIVPITYDALDTFVGDGLENFIQIKIGKKYGVVDYNGKVVIPAEFEHVGDERQFFRVVTFDRKFGLYEKNGKLLVPAEYDWIGKSHTQGSKLLILRKGNDYQFMDTNNRMVLSVPVSSYGYVLDQENLLNDDSFRHQYLLYVKGKDGKMGAINETSGELAIPIVYDAILQKKEGSLHMYYTVKKGAKYGLVDERGQVILPFQYDKISLDLIGGDLDDRRDEKMNVVVAKNGKMGTVDLKGQAIIPLIYSDLQRISYTGLYKAKTGKYYQLINEKNKVLNAGPFDELANFEEGAVWDGGKLGQEALSFYQGSMRPIDQNGKFLNAAVSMQPHKGYRTFDELKAGLVAALDSKDDQQLKRFAAQVAPSEHILYFVKYNDFDRKPLGKLSVEELRDTYYQALLNFRENQWNSGRYVRSSLTGIADYTSYRNDQVSNSRREDHAFGDRFMEVLLRNAVKINGYWISTYFMHRNFGKY